ncbi:MAG: choline TMA-lyase-activating enzyme [Anaerotignaceae bacterium]
MDNMNVGIIQRKGTIFNVQKYNMYDGPGLRTMVFFKGCPLRCKWCSNPEGLEKKFQVMFKINACVNCGACVSVCPVGIHTISKEEHKHGILRNIDCIGCNKCVEVCNARALTIVGKVKSISELLEIVKEDKPFYEVSGGGVTLSGGEVLMQVEAATSLLQACKLDGINTAIETSGYAKLENVLKIAEFTDLFLFDIKQMDSSKHFQLTQVRNELILSNLAELLRRRFNVKIRMPMLKGINDSEEEIKAAIDFLMPYKDDKNFKGIDLLPYHKLGVNKYLQLGMEYSIDGDPSLTEEDLKRIEGFIKKYDFPVCVVRH